MKRIAISNTIPSEIIYAAGHQLVDLNNVLVTSNQTEEWIEDAEYQGFPKSLCAWIKGVYTACLESKPDLFIGVHEGDCSNTKSLNEILRLRGIEVVPFGYSHHRTKERFMEDARELMSFFNVSDQCVQESWKQLNRCRALAKRIDEMTYDDNQITGFENHLWLVSCSDFNSNPKQFEDDLTSFIESAQERPKRENEVRLAYLGVPPMVGDLYDFTESLGARVVFNEVQREFSMHNFDQCTHWSDQYLMYTYPYDNQLRLEAIREQLVLRKIDGIIHYTQAFCHRALDDLLIRDALELPVLTVEGDKSGVLDGRTKLRLEAYIDMLKDRRK